MSFLKLGIIGYPLTHSLSPLLHAELMRGLGLAGEYAKYELPPEQLVTRLRELEQQGLRGLNVTIPHKVAVMQEMDWLSPQAELAGAVNTIVFETQADNGGIKRRGHNTDIAGFMRSLPPQVREALPHSHLLILGAGGSARAVMTGLIEARTQAITFAVRNPAKALSITSDGQLIKTTLNSPTRLNLVALETVDDLSGFAGLINTTPVGMYPQIETCPLRPALLDSLPESGWVYDLIYRPLETQLLQQASQRNRLSLNGLDMLIYQGICAFELWSGRPVPDPLVNAVRHSLQQQLEASPSP
ncbi:shikimate dehydrogenase family protein [Vampirovibrio chlorellavorus]|uniref:shikimate dehydrogenase family protein n=1 Tax=Vampirovibrio chlorellavorus TaxID=758823 RepID=UPI0026EADACD|nr:shikimate dehydrogenase [Vampirovibrio chlorellavorus]